MLSRVRVSRCNVFVVASMLSVLGFLVFAGVPASAAVTHTYLSQLTGFGEPTAVAVDAAGDVYVVDSSAGTVDRFSSAGAPLAFSASESYVEGSKLTGTPGGSFGEPRGVAVNDENGDLYVADRTAGVVDVFSSTGVYLSQLTGPPATAPVPGPFQCPWGLAVDQSTHDLYVTNTCEGAVVDVFSSTGVYVSQFGAGVVNGFSRGVAVNDLTGDAYIETTSEGGGSSSEVDVFGSMGSFLTPAWNGAGTPEGPFGFDTLHVGLDPTTHHVYVIDARSGVVDEFAASASEEYLGQLTGTPAGPFSGPQAVAVNPANGDLYVADGGEGSGVVDVFGPAIEVPGTSVQAATGLTTTTAVVSGSVNPAGIQVTACEFEYGTSTSYGQSAPCEPAPAQIGAGNSPKAVTANLSALQPNTTYHYRLTAANANGSLASSDETFTTPLPPPTVTIGAVTQIGGSSATFNGVINPNGLESEYHFEYSTDGHHWNALAEGNAGSGSTGVPVSQTVSNLIGDTSYHVRLVGSLSGRESATSSAVTFTTAAEAPTISQTLAAPVSATSATLNAYIDPNNLATTYHFQYGTSTSYGSQAPEDESNIGSGHALLPVAQSISGLQPDTTYHFRVVAINSSTSYGPDTTFTTEASLSCPNEQVRSESDVNPETGVPFSLALPECRAYEMVSPALKDGAPLTSSPSPLIDATTSVARVGLEGSTVLIRSTGVWPGGEQPANNDLDTSAAAEAVRYRVTRGESGWRFQPEVPSALDLRIYKSAVVPGGGDLGLNGIWTGAGFAPSETESKISLSPIDNIDGNIYLLEPNGALAEVGPSVPLSDRGAPDEAKGDVIGFPGASADLSRMLFELPDFRWSFDQTRLAPLFGSQSLPEIYSLYEYVGTGHTGVEGDVPTLVGVDNAGSLISQCGTYAGGAKVTEGISAAQEGTAISAGGSTVFFTARAAGSLCQEEGVEAGTGPATDQLFARIGEPGKGAAVGSAVTVNVAGSTGCGASDSCDVTKAVSYQGASRDGSKVFFTSEQPLTGGTDSTNNLYECKLPGDSGAALVPVVRPVNPCPDLVGVSVPVAGGADVQSVAAISEDGSHVYFVAKGALTGPNAEHNSPTLGKDNLYVWEEGHTAFITTLPSATLGTEGERAQTTPDGDSLVFTSAADLTPDDTSTVSQVFLYEAQHEALIRVSKSQGGADGDGNTTINPATIATGDERKTISDDGSDVVFQSSQALTGQVHGGERNVYLWRGGNVYLISDGTPGGDKSGKEEDPGPGNAEAAGLIGIDASGQNIFFTTEARMVGQDADELPDLYDARIDGGFPAPKNNECVGEACQGAPPSPPSSLSPGSLFSGGPGNLARPVKSTITATKPRALTRSEKLAKALKACEKAKSKKKRAQCEATAHKRYGTKAKRRLKSKHKTGKSSGKGDK